MTGFGAKQVGEIAQPPRMLRTPRNPMDKATIVSLFPVALKEVKETLDVREYKIPAGSLENPTVITIGPAAWWRHDFDNDQKIENPVAATTIAHSVITDYCNGLLECDMESKMPAMFYIPGEISKDVIMKNYKDKLNEMNTKQRRWFEALVVHADALWSRSNHNPKVIWDMMKLAARELGSDRAWLKDFNVVNMVKCFACGNLRDPEYPVCTACKSIDPKHPLAKDLMFAK